MTKREIASLVIKLMGVFILLRIIAYVPTALSGMFYSLRSDSALYAVGMVLLSVLMVGVSLAWALVIIFLSDKFAVWIIKDDTARQPVHSSVSRDDVMLIAVSCIGLYFIAAAIPMVLRGLLYHATFMQNHMGNPFAGPSGLLNLLRELLIPAVQIAIGLCLFIGSNGLVKFWNKIRS